MMASQHKLINLSELDLVLRPPLPPDMSVMDWRRHSELVADGLEFTRSELERLTEQSHPVIRMARAISKSDQSYRRDCGD